MAYSDNALALFADTQRVSVATAGQYDGLIAKTSTGSVVNSLFAEYPTGHCQVAYDADIPCIGFHENRPELYVAGTLGRYPKADDDPQIKALDRALRTNGILRAVDSLMVDCSVYRQSDGNDAPLLWLVGSGRHLMETAYERYGLPVYLWMTLKTMQHYKNDPQYEALVKLVCDFGSCFNSSYAIAVENGYPAASESQSNHNPYDGVDSKGKKVPWYFWGFSQGSQYAFLYNGNRAKLFSDLGYVERNPDGSGEGNGENPDENPDNGNSGGNVENPDEGENESGKAGYL
jgi:hypothetical protein